MNAIMHITSLKIKTISQPKKEEDTINNVITHKEDKNDVHRHRSN